MAQQPPIASAPAPLSGTLSPGLPLLLYGIRLWAAVCLALFVAFYLQLDNPSWAGTSAAIVCQPVLGASLRKGWFRLIGTVLGAVASVVLTALFPQSRAGFLLGLAVWGAACAFAATLLRNFASYAAALAGYTTAIVAGDELGLVGGANGDAFNLAVARASEICLGIICASLVLASTDLGNARRRLSTLLSSLASEVTSGLLDALKSPGVTQGNSRPVRRDLIRRVAGLAIPIDQASGEITGLPFRPRLMQMAADGLFAALSAWRIIATHLERRPEAQDHDETQQVLRAIADEIQATAGHDAAAFETQPLRLRRMVVTTSRRLVALPAKTPSLRLLADRAAEGFFGISQTLTGIAALHQPAPVEFGPRMARLRVPDLMPAVINAIRAFLTIGAAELIWIETAWPGGAGFITFATITIILFAPREDAAFGMTRNFMLGTAVTAALAGIIAFAVLPAQTTFAGFCGAIGLVLVPAGALSAQSWKQPIFVATAANFIPLLGPSNAMTYDPGSFYNTASALLAGVGLSMLALRLFPPLPPAYRARRLLALTLRDLRRLAAGVFRVSTRQWEGRVYGRLGAMPDQADPLQRARLAAAVAVGAEIIRLRRMATRFDIGSELDQPLQAIAGGKSQAAIDGLRRFDSVVAALPSRMPGARLRMRLRATTGAIAEALSLHADYFDATRLT